MWFWKILASWRAVARDLATRAYAEDYRLRDPISRSDGDYRNVISFYGDWKAIVRLLFFLRRTFAVGPNCSPFKVSH